MDVKVSQFLVASIQNCNSKSPESIKLVTALQNKINSNFITEVIITQKIAPVKKLPTKAQAVEILKESGIQARPQDQQQLAEEIIEETQNIEAVAAVTGAISGQTKTIVKTVTQEEQTIIEEAIDIADETIDSNEPTQEEIAQKEEEIIEQIEEAAASQETGVILPSPTATLVPVLPSPTSSPVVTLAPTVAPVAKTTPTPTTEQVSAPATEPTSAEEPTLIETVTETVSEPASTPTPPSI